MESDEMPAMRKKALYLFSFYFHLDIVFSRLLLPTFPLLPSLLTCTQHTLPACLTLLLRVHVAASFGIHFLFFAWLACLSPSAPAHLISPYMLCIEPHPKAGFGLEAKGEGEATSGRQFEAKRHLALLRDLNRLPLTFLNGTMETCFHYAYAVACQWLKDMAMPS